MNHEEVVIGNLLFYGKKAMHTAKEVLSERDFALDPYREAYKSMVEIYNKGENWDLPRIATQFQNAEKMTATLLCKTYIHSITPFDMFYHHVKELHKSTLELELQTAINMGVDYREIKEKILELENVQTTDMSSLGNNDAVIGALERYEKELKNPIEFPTGFQSFDSDFGGFHRGDLVIIGGCTSQGKTNFSLNIALNIVKNNKKVLMLNGEMSSDQLIQRFLCMHGNIDSSRLRNKTINERDWKEITKSASEFRKYAFSYCCKSAITTSLVSKMVNKISPDVIIVDFIQLMADTMGKESRALHLANLARGLKNIAIENNICVIALSQLNREAARRDDMPRLSDLRESGGIEEAADIVMLIWSGLDKNTNVYVAKNRHGIANVGFGIKFNRTNLKMEQDNDGGINAR